MTDRIAEQDSLMPVSIDALIRQLGDLDPTNEPLTTKQIGREAADTLSQMRDALAAARPYVVRALAQDEMREREGKPGGKANVPVIRSKIDKIDAVLTTTKIEKDHTDA